MPRSPLAPSRPVLSPRRAPVVLGAVLAALFALTVASRASAAIDDLVKVDSTLWMTNSTVNAITRSGTILYIGGNFTSVYPYTGGAASLDVPTAMPVSPFPRTNGTVWAAVPDGAGGWYLGGAFTKLGSVPRQNLAHVLANGTVDGWNPGADNTVYALAVNGSNVFAGGAFANAGGQARNYLAAIDRGTGQAVPGWNPAPGNHVTALVLNGSTLYLGGYFTAMGAGPTTPRQYLAAVDAASGALLGWDPKANGLVRCLAIGGSTMYIGGEFTAMHDSTRLRIAAVDLSAGALRPWNPRSTGRVYTLAVNATTVYVGMQPDSIGGVYRRGLAAIGVNSNTADAWNPDPQGTGDVYALALGATTIFAGGNFSVAGGQPRNNIAEIRLDNGLATSWDANANLNVYVLARAGSRMFAGGGFTSIGIRTRNRIAAIDATTGALTGWDPDLDGTVRQITVRNGLVYACGDFKLIASTRPSPIVRNHLVAIDSVTADPTQWNPNATSTRTVNAFVFGPSSMFVGGTFTSIGGHTQSDLAEVDLLFGNATGWNPNANGIVSTLLLDGSTLYAGGYFTSLGDSARSRIGAVSTATGKATPWNPNVTGTSSNVLAMALEGSTLYAGGYFTAVGDSARTHLAAISTATGRATAWAPQPNGTVRAIVTNGARVFVGGDFSVIGVYHDTRNRLASLDAAGAADPTWDPNMGNPVYSLALDHQLVYAGGTFTTVHAGDYPERYLAGFRFTPGTVDVPLTPLATPRLALASAPNPIRDRAQLRFTLPEAGEVSLEVYDAAGRRVGAPIEREWLVAGPHQVTLEARALAAGCYFARLSAGPHSGVAKLIVVR